MKETDSHNFARRSRLAFNVLEKEMADLYLPFCEKDDQHKATDVSEPLKPFAAFGSFRQRHGDVLDHNNVRTIEAPAKLESAASISSARLDTLLMPSDCEQIATFQTSKPYSVPYRRGKSFSTDLDREEAWERKKQQYLLEEEEEDSDGGEEYDADGFFNDEFSEKGPADESSWGSDDGGTLHEDGSYENEKRIVEHVEGSLDDAHEEVAHTDEGHLYASHEDGLAKGNKRMPLCRRKSYTRRPVKACRRARTKSLTDEDMEELRGSIDLGFGFSYSGNCNLKSTLPALELYYAINKNYVDAQSRSLPGSPLVESALVRTNSVGSTSSPSSETWRISSPGDRPSQVKTRLRHWAQAVACSVKQGY